MCKLFIEFLSLKIKYPFFSNKGFIFDCFTQPQEDKVQSRLINRTAWSSKIDHIKNITRSFDLSQLSAKTWFRVNLSQATLTHIATPFRHKRPPQKGLYPAGRPHCTLRVNEKFIRRAAKATRKSNQTYDSEGIEGSSLSFYHS